MQKTEYSAVIVTRNRPDALALSLPLLLAQSRAPAAVYVIDSSDDPGPNIAIVDKLAPTSDIPLHHEVGPSGMTRQRNIGLAHVTTDVVLFPDDDSLIYPDALEAMMRIYDLDTQGRVGGVCSAEARRPPQGVLGSTSQASYSMTRADRIKARVSRTRFAIEGRLAPDPFFKAAERAYQGQGIAPGSPDPEWLQAENAILVPWMTGFRMSFRTDLIRRTGFDEHLGRYALFEDTDAGFGILRDHILVGARQAEIYHHKAPAHRANGRAMGAMQMLNRAYILARAGHTDKAMRANFSRFSLYKIAQYVLGARSSFGRARLAGAWTAYRLSLQMFDASAQDLTALYLDLRAQCFETEN